MQPIHSESAITGIHADVGTATGAAQPAMAAAPTPVGSEGMSELSELTINEKSFRIRVADTAEGRSSAGLLINKMYSWRGYAGTHKIDDDPSRITLSASDKGEIVGTVTLGIDSPVGILADEVFGDVIAPFRARGAKVCEITKLAFDPNVRSKMVLASLFHIVFIYGRRLHQCTDVFIEVNPRHRRFYESMLGFKRMGEVRSNPRVDAPAYLLWTNLDIVQEKIERFGGTSSNPGEERSLFPYFFSQKEEAGITQRLVSLG